MYSELFNAVTDSVESLKRIEKEIEAKKQRLIIAQQRSEKLYIEGKK